MADKNVAAVFAIVLGIFGGHKFYLGQTKKGYLYMAFCWTAIPAAFGIIDGIRFLLISEERFQKNHVKQMGDKTADSDDYIMMADGRNGQLTLFEHKVRISRKGIISTLTNPFKGDKDIRLDDITSIQFREPGTATVGYIQIGQSGYDESDDGVFDATSDENSVTFAKGVLDDFKQIREEIEKRRISANQAGTGMDSGLERLREKYAEGEISEEEFRKKKKVLEE
jgi:uncharacterized membrane protein